MGLGLVTVPLTDDVISYWSSHCDTDKSVHDMVHQDGADAHFH